MTAGNETPSPTTLATGPFGDYDLARSLVAREWGTDALVIAGKVRATDDMSLIAATRADGRVLGIAYYAMTEAVALLGAIVVVDASEPGVGTMLFNAVADEARTLKLKKLRAITTNDNFEAMKFYQKRGMHFLSLFPGGMNAYRAFKPNLRSEGRHGIACRDMLELEMDL